MATWPADPIVLPEPVQSGDKVLAAHQNTTTQAVADLWTNLQTAAQDTTTAPGDLLVSDGMTLQPLHVAQDGLTLVLDSASPLRMKWGPGGGGSSSSTFYFKVDGKSTAPNDPRALQIIRYDNATQVAATSLYFDVLTADGLDVSRIFGALGQQQEFTIQDKGLSQSYQVWRQTGPVVPSVDWFTVPVEYVSGSAPGGGDAQFRDKLNVVVLLTGGAGDLPSTPPPAGSKQLWYDPADGNRVKYVP